MTPDELTVARLQADATLRARGHRYEDFALGRKFVHHWGRTVTQADNTLFSALTLHYNPHYTNAAFANAHGHPATVINPLLVFNTVFGLSVEDLSEGGGPFLGVDELVYLRRVYPGDTLHACSEVLARRLARSRPGYGIVTWHTRGTNQRGDEVIAFKRSNLVKTRN
ncbi:MaoC family dehydratase [Verminephrobacter eiseniae]|uniref:MaoC family dehydratase n=1 Tax=Verminephrobacter eiseniae TaxID=364317 RepID=UPI0010D93AD1|nr:MaoC family dehydratase [Verminephrobacter eiseniae]KAB7632445.1 MaoC family dehydratase [Verminephrobacter sp. Larva24]MCW5234772.1 MaoC family dehydratase [Verminephrobacter eiseniae]MCW5294075.1 MaoC family dehydratase [Verminephrobacter eiseniae]MCW8183187.1 MaoC family dehydratase [Verminephrobacter eiseniae]MCW8222128.1 MaoC family dehydratase [Verminephrobacter eiseniae]